MPVRIDDDVREWIMTLKAMYGTANVSDTLRQALITLHPNIAEVTDKLREYQSQQASILAELKTKDR
jgi:hypothetical protein